MPVENDCEDQGMSNISDGCRVCQFWEGDKLVRPEIKDRGDGFLCCVNCGGSYGLVAISATTKEN